MQERVAGSQGSVTYSWSLERLYSVSAIGPYRPLTGHADAAAQLHETGYS